MQRHTIWFIYGDYVLVFIKHAPVKSFCEDTRVNSLQLLRELFEFIHSVL